MGIVRLGSNVLRWCDDCNLPILEEKKCPKCGNDTHEVSLTPPGDCRPAFNYDIEMIRRVTDDQFNEGCGEILLPEKHVAILNRSPSLDRMDEIVLDGEVLGAIIFDPPFGDRLIIRPSAAIRMLPKLNTSRVVADSGALPSMKQGSNLMGPGVISADQGICIGDEVIVLSEDGRVVATGLARKTGKDMMARGKGVAVKIRWSIESDSKSIDKENSWDDVVSINKSYIEKRVQTAKNFIQDLAKKHDKPIAVSFSGGKDSLATLHLALESGLKPKILFADTGLELPETIREVNRTAEETGLELLTEEAGEAFWENIEYFGPPGKDFRWCCKICKLGPTTRLITKNFPNGVVSLIGQRSYESEQRMRKGSVWQNPWVPGQIGASPIQKWPALLVWLYIFSRRLKYNPWYERGLDRIGCYLCPSSDISELETVKGSFKDYSRWDEYLREYREKRNLPDDWQSLAIWRWRRLPPAMKNKLAELNLHFEEIEESSLDDSPMRLRIAKGYRPCDDGGISSEGVFSRKLDIERVANLLNIIGSVELHKDENIAKTANIIVFGEGGVSIKEKDEVTNRKLADVLEQVVVRAMFCVGCGVCIGRCKNGALRLEKQISIIPEKCAHCGDCLGICPVLRFEKVIEL